MVFSYDHTLFRFPLRHEGYKSQISSSAYSVKSVRERLFENLVSEGHLSLLFLKNVERMKVYHKESKHSEPQLIYSVEITDECHEDVRQGRKRLFDSILGERKGTYNGDFLMKLKTNREGDERHFSYLVSQRYDHGPCSEMLEDEKLKYMLPLVGVALPVTGGDPGGHLFCFLPLPARGSKSQTGCRPHINGSFAVSQNRREMKLPSYETNPGKLEDPQLLWNLRLISDLLPQSLVWLMKNAAATLLSKRRVDPDAYHSIYPYKKGLEGAWQNIHARFVEMIKGEKLFCAKRGGEAVMVGVQGTVFMANRAEGRSEEVDVLIEMILQRAGLPVVRIQRLILDDVVEHCGGKVDTNDMVAQFLRSGHHIALSDDERILLLEEFLKSGDCNLLRGTCLLPTRGGAFTSLEPGGPNVRPLYVENHSDFWTTLPQIKDRFLDVDLISDPGVSVIRSFLQEGECETHNNKSFNTFNYVCKCLYVVMKFNFAFVRLLAPQEVQRRLFRCRVEGIVPTLGKRATQLTIKIRGLFLRGSVAQNLCQLPKRSLEVRRPLFDPTVRQKLSLIGKVGSHGEPGRVLWQGG